MADKQTATPHLVVGDTLTETTTTGHKRRWTVVEHDAEPKYPKDDERPYVKLVADDARRSICFMSERVIFSIDWMVRDDG